MNNKTFQVSIVQQLIQFYDVIFSPLLFSARSMPTSIFTPTEFYTGAAHPIQLVFNLEMDGSKRSEDAFNRSVIESESESEAADARSEYNCDKNDWI